MTKHWPNDSLPLSKESSASEPRCLPSQTLMTPSMEDVPRQKNEKVRTGHSRVTGKDGQQELDRVRSKSRKWSKSRKQSKSHRRSKSKKRSKSHGHDEGGAHGKHEVPKPGVWMSQYKEEESGQSPSSTTQQDKQHAEQLAPSSERSKFLKLKEVVKHAQSYI